MTAGRFYFFVILIILVTLVLGGRLYQLQVRKGAFYEALAQGQREFLQEVRGRRGRIFLTKINCWLIIASSI